jgi:hypothetical protein
VKKLDNPLTPAEKAALAAWGWRKSVRRNGGKPTDDANALLMAQLDAIYDEVHK